MIHNAEKFNNIIMKKFFLLIKIIVVYLFLISNGISKELIYYSEGIKFFQKKNLINQKFYLKEILYLILKAKNLIYFLQKFLVGKIMMMNKKLI